MRSGSGGDGFGSGSDRLDDARTPLVAPKMRRFEDSPHRPIPAERLAQHVASYHVDDDAGYQAEFEASLSFAASSIPISLSSATENFKEVDSSTKKPIT